MAKMNHISMMVETLGGVCPKMVTTDGMRALERLCDMLGIDNPIGYYNGAHGDVCFTTAFFDGTKQVAEEIRFRLDHIGQVDVYPPTLWADTLELIQDFLKGIIY